ncbi:MAG: hypothetical protein ACXADD_19570 [Candidatus Thorarchaeota archaeon]|jgi:hypothetical protein
MKRARCQFGVIVFVSLILVIGSVGLGPGNLLNEASFARTVVGTAMTSDVSETIVIMPPPSDFSWGWVGWLTFVYWDVALDAGIANATVTCQGWIPELDIFDYNNGSYFFFLNTTEKNAKLDPYILILTFEKENYDTQVVTYAFRIYPVPTEALIQVPEYNVNGTIFDLIVPVGDSLDIRFLYNDTDSSEGYVGGLTGADTFATIYGPTLVRRDTSLTDCGDGTYSFMFDTLASWLFEATDGVPAFHELPYILEVEFNLDNRMSCFTTIRVCVIEIPTLLEGWLDSEISMPSGGSAMLSFSYIDAWPGHELATISDANITVEISEPQNLVVDDIVPNPEDPGIYDISVHCNENNVFGTALLTIKIEKENYAPQVHTVMIQVIPIEGPFPPPAPPFNLIALELIIIAWAYPRYKRKREQLKSPASVD